MLRSIVELDLLLKSVINLVIMKEFAQFKIIAIAQIVRYFARVIVDAKTFALILFQVAYVSLGKIAEIKISVCA